MSNKQDSNVIRVDFGARNANSKTQRKDVAKPVAYGDMITDALEGPEEWPEDLTPRQRTDKLAEDLEFFLQSKDNN